MSPKRLFAVTLVATCLSISSSVPCFARIRPEQQLEGALGGALERTLMYELRNLQVQNSKNWNNKIRVWRGKTKVVFQGLKSRVVKIYDHVNHGLWSRATVRMENAADELDVKLRRFRATPGRLELRFQIYVRSMFRGKVEARHYSHGKRLWTATVKGRARAHMYLNMRVYIYDSGRRLGWQVESADIKYSDVVVDRVGRLGGYSARIIGDAFTGAVRTWFAKKERAAIGQAKKAVSKAISGNRSVSSQVTRVIRLLASASGRRPVRR